MIRQERSAGKAYRDATAWRLPALLPDEVAKFTVNNAAPGAAPKLVFSGLDSSVAGEIESASAESGPAVSECVCASANPVTQRERPTADPVIHRVGLFYLRGLILTPRKRRGRKEGRDRREGER